MKNTYRRGFRVGALGFRGLAREPLISRIGFLCILSSYKDYEMMMLVCIQARTVGKRWGHR